MRELVVIAYEDEKVADRAAEELRRGSDDLLLEPDASAVLVCERDGSSHLTIKRTEATAPWSRFWGAFMESLLGEEGAAMDTPFRERLRWLLRPGTSMLLIAAPFGKESIVDALSHFGGETVTCMLDDELPRRWGASGLNFER